MTMSSTVATYFEPYAVKYYSSFVASPRILKLKNLVKNIEKVLLLSAKISVLNVMPLLSVALLEE